MIRKKNLFPAMLLLLLVSCETPEEQYDRETGQSEVLSRDAIDEVLAGFETVTLDELDDHYHTYTDPEKKFENKLKNLTYYIVRGHDLYKFIVGRYRIDDFLCTDEYYLANRDDMEGGHCQYWLVDEKMLYMVLDLVLELDRQGYDKYGFYVRESHRHPAYNKERGGASLSQHIYGRAADLVIEDINRDGKITPEDKTIVLEILEEIVDDKGGLGLYPGTMTVHVDSRGYRARWNQQK